MEINEYIDEYIRNIKNINIKAKSTSLAYSSVLKNYYNYLIQNNINNITDVNFSINEAFILSEKSNKRETTINQTITVLKSFFNYLNSKYDIENSAYLLRSYKKQKNIPDILNEDDILELIRVHNDSDDEILEAALFDMMYSCGLRVSEVCELKINNIDFSERFIRVFGKGSKSRYIPVPEKAMVNIIKYIKLRDLKNKMNVKYLFINKQGKKINRKWVYRHLLARCNKYGIKCDDIHPHILRHSYASALLNRGVDLRVIQTLLGHEDISTTEIYTHLLDEKIIDEYNRFFVR